MKILPFVYTFLIVFFLASCSPKSNKSLKAPLETPPLELPEREEAEVEIQTKPSIKKTAPYLLLSMSQEDCIGKCPVFKWSLISDGTMKYTGEKDVARYGVFKGRLSEEQVQAVRQKALEVGLLEMPGRFPVQGEIVEEVPATILYFRDAGQSNSIVNKHHAPKGLLAFQAYILDIIEGSKWERDTKKDRL